MSDFKMEMRLLNTRHFACSAFGVGDLIFSESIFTVEHHRPASGGEQTLARSFRGGGRRQAAVFFCGGEKKKQTTSERCADSTTERRNHLTHPCRLEQLKGI